MEDKLSNVSDLLKNSIDALLEESSMNLEDTKLLENIKVSTLAARASYHFSTSDSIELVALPEEAAIALAEEAFVAAFEHKSGYAAFQSLLTESEDDN